MHHTLFALSKWKPHWLLVWAVLIASAIMVDRIVSHNEPETTQSVFGKKKVEQ